MQQLKVLVASFVKRHIEDLPKLYDDRYDIKQHGKRLERLEIGEVNGDDIVERNINVKAPATKRLAAL